MSLQRRALTGSIAAMAGTILLLLQAVIQVPLLLSYWSADNYGEWATVLATTAIVSIFSLGHHAYIGNVVNRLWIESRLQFVETLRSAFITSIFIAVFEVATIGALALKYSGSRHHASTAYAFLVWAVFWISSGAAAGIVAKIYIPIGKFARAQWIGNLYRFTGFAALVAVASLGGGVVAAMVGQAVTWAIVNWWTLRDVRKYVPELFPLFQTANFKQGLRNAIRSMHTTINGILDQIALNGTTLLVRESANASAVAAFTTIRTLSNSALLGTAILLTPISPDLVRYHIAKDGQRLRAILGVGWLSVNSATCCGFIGCLPIIAEIYRWWTKGRIPLEIPLLLLVSVGVIVRQWSSPVATYAVSINLLGIQSLSAAARVLCAILCTLLGISSLGLIAVGLGVLIGECVAALIIVVGVVHQFSKMQASFPTRSAIFSALQVGAVGVASVAVSQCADYAPLVLVLCFLLCVVAALAQWLALELATREKLVNSARVMLGNLWAL